MTLASLKLKIPRTALESAIAIAILIAFAAICWGSIALPYLGMLARQKEDRSQLVDRIDTLTSRLVEARQQFIDARERRFEETPELRFATSPRQTATQVASLHDALTKTAASHGLTVAPTGEVQTAPEGELSRSRATLTLDGPWSNLASALAAAANTQNDRLIERIEFQALTALKGEAHVRATLQFSGYSFGDLSNDP